MNLFHDFVEKIAHSSYIVGGEATCAVIDPRRDVDVYIREARARGLKITHILQTHLHADFISGHMDLAARTGARIYAPKTAKCAFPHVPLSEGDSFMIEHLKFDFLDTPGHTPEHGSYVVTDTDRGRDPDGVFCGDTLFVGDVGRPDLFPDMAVKLAGKLFDSLHGKLLKLPAFCEVYPAHGAGSLCGRSMSAKQRSTIGYEKKYNPALRIRNKAEFIRSLTTNMPPAPDHFSRCSDINRRGPVRVEKLPDLLELNPAEFMKKTSGKGAVVLDVRNYDAFGGQHIPKAWNIGLAGNFPTFVGWLIPWKKPVYLVADGYTQAVEAVTWARRVGVDGVKGYLAGGMSAWAAAGYPTSSVPQISAEALREMVERRADFILLDIRAPLEFQESHIPGAVNMAVQDIRTSWKELPRSADIVVLCSSGNRSSVAASMLKQRGFAGVMNSAGGIKGYRALGAPLTKK
ncbi:MAG: MBL fold metallo-hydrolase [Acidobacteriota bacterium]|nr:MBL fold metallo-hydrolase [Acidobacteriota bacterium]